MAIDLIANVYDVTGTISIANAKDSLINGSDGTDANINTGTGNDTIRTGGGNDGVWAGDGNDRVNAKDGNTAKDVVTVHAGEGKDYVFGGAGSNNLYGEGGNDLLVGGAGNDRIDGGDGDDHLDARGGTNWMTGGAGNDVFRFKVSAGQKMIDFNAMIGNTTITDFQHGQDKIDLGSIFARMKDSDVDAFLDHVIAASHETYTTGLPSVEKDSKPITQILVQGAAATLGDSTIEYSVISSVTKGGSKSFEIQFHTVGDTAPWSSLKIDNLSTLTRDDFLRETVKIAHGTNGGDGMDFSGLTGDKGVRVYGFAGDDWINGSQNRDVLIGGNGNDVMHGGEARDELDGGNGNDCLFGDGGSDFLYGGRGENHLTGGAMKDFFVFGGTVDKAGHFILDEARTIVTDFKFGMDFIKFANMGDGYSGSLANARLEQRFDLKLKLDAIDSDHRADDLVIYSDGKGTEYVLQNFFDGHNGYRDDAGVRHALKGDQASFLYVQNHIDDFVVWA